MSIRLVAAVAAALVSTVAVGQTAKPAGYPTKPIRLIVPLVAGGPTDILGRIISVPLGEALGQQVIVDNRPGAGGNIGADLAAKSPADGYTLFMGTSGPLAINSSLYPKLPYDPIKDFAPVILAASAPFVVIVNPAVPAGTLKELIALAKAKPGQLNYGSVPGSASHLSPELFKLVAGLNIVHIPYKGAAPATTDVIAGQIQLSFASTPGAVPMVKANKVKALAVTSLKRVGKLPDVPTVAEAALESTQWWGAYGPAGLPAAIVGRLNAELNKVLRTDDMKKRLAPDAVEPAGGTPDDLARYLREDFEKWGKVVKSAHIRAE